MRRVMRCDHKEKVLVNIGPKSSILCCLNCGALFAAEKEFKEAKEWAKAHPETVEIVGQLCGQLEMKEVKGNE